MKGKVWILNVWSSWCVSCKEEHPLLVALSNQNIVPIYGLDYKDKREDGEGWLARAGNPYLLSASDFEGRVGIDYGVYGVPESYVIDKQGIIQYKEIGPITPEKLKDKILPLVAQLQAK
jgi:cytochrome c biogenesis protein CcmG/thiol:disulfide interchange protein DsbE